MPALARCESKVMAHMSPFRLPSSSTSASVHPSLSRPTSPTSPRPNIRTQADDGTHHHALHQAHTQTTPLAINNEKDTASTQTAGTHVHDPHSAQYAALLARTRTPKRGRTMLVKRTLNLTPQPDTNASPCFVDMTERLSDALVTEILLLLSHRNLCQLARVSKRWKTHCSETHTFNTHLDLSIWREMIMPKTIRNLALRVPRLQYLSLFRCRLNLASLSTLLQNCPRLHTLNLSYVSQPAAIPEVSVPPVCILQLPASLRNVNLRNCEVVQTKDVMQVLRVCTDLRILNLGMIPCLSSVANVAAVVECLRTAQCRRKLTSLHLNNNRGVTDAAVEQVAMSCPSLNCFFLDMCVALRDAGVQALCLHLPKLRSLGLCTNTISDRSLMAIAEHCQALERLEISFCRFLTEEGLQMVFAECAFLKHVNLCLVEGLTDRNLLTLARHGQLQYLNVRACPALSDTGINGLAQYCAALKMVHLMDIDLVSTEAVKLLKERVPAVTVIF